MSRPHSARVPYEYAIIRAIPRIERGEQINVGVLLYCQRRDFVAACTRLDVERLRALDAGVDVAAVRAALTGWERTCQGGAAGGAARQLRPGERFRWLTAPRSTLCRPARCTPG